MSPPSSGRSSPASDASLPKMERLDSRCFVGVTPLLKVCEYAAAGFRRSSRRDTWFHRFERARNDPSGSESAKGEAFCSVFVTATRCRARTILNVLTRFRKRLSDRGIGVAMLPTRCTMWRQNARKGIQRGHFRRRLRFQIHIGFSTRDQDAPRTRIDC